jgi:hypothetical protein
LKAFKLVPRPLDKGPRPKSGKLRLNLHGTCFGEKINWFGPKHGAKMRGKPLKGERTPDLENPESG